jgi:xylulokinase
MKTLGIDIGSSSVKVSLLDVQTGRCEGSVQLPDTEMPIKAHVPGWAEQDPLMWWDYLVKAIHQLIKLKAVKADEIKAIGISYQMHGWVGVDKWMNPVRSSIIWCDSRAVGIGNKAFKEIGKEKCLSRLLNSPGNFTASKFAWVKENESELYEKIAKIMLPGDFIALKLSGEATTTMSGLSEGMMWDFHAGDIADFLLEYYGFEKDKLSTLVPAFGLQAQVSRQAALETGLKEGTPVTYRAGDQPNNAFSLNVLEPGEIAATAGTSGVVYGVTEAVKSDPFSRVNTFAHVNHSEENPRLGVLLCINGTGIMNSWMKKLIAPSATYDEINKLAATIPAGSEGVLVHPFGNGAERMLKNHEPGCSINGLNFNTHSSGHLFRAAQEGIAFSFIEGMKIMEGLGIHPRHIRAGRANMFLSPVFRQTLADLSGAVIELYDTDGSLGAARGAAIGAGLYSSCNEAFSHLEKLAIIEPDPSQQEVLKEAYVKWAKILNTQLMNQ